MSGQYLILISCIIPNDCTVGCRSDLARISRVVIIRRDRGRVAQRMRLDVGQVVS